MGKHRADGTGAHGLVGGRQNDGKSVPDGWDASAHERSSQRAPAKGNREDDAAGFPAGSDTRDVRRK